MFVASPELAFVQAAASLPLAPLLLIGFEWCGSYARVPDGLASAPPLTTPERIARYLERLPPIAGLVQARRTLTWVLANAASPLESALAILLTLPMAQGGYGFTAPVLNHPIEAQGSSHGARTVATKAFYKPDLYWPDHRVGLEYDSTAYHTQEDRIAADAQRRLALAALGVDLVTVTRPQLYRTDAFNQVAQALALKLHRRLRITAHDFARRRSALREAVLYGNAKPWDPVG